MLAATTRPDSSATDVLPTLAGTVAGGIALYYLVRAAHAVTASEVPAVAGRAGRTRAAGIPAQPAPGRRPGAGQAGAAGPPGQA